MSNTQKVSQFNNETQDNVQKTWIEKLEHFRTLYIVSDVTSLPTSEE